MNKGSVIQIGENVTQARPAYRRFERSQELALLAKDLVPLAKISSKVGNCGKICGKSSKDLKE